MAGASPTVICIGAGPAGLTAAYLLGKAGAQVTVLERDSALVGGLSRTVGYKGFRIDIGGHRFFSKSAEVEALWTEILGADLLERPRKSRIHYRGKWFDYPLDAMGALRNLGPIEAAACVLSYGRARLFPAAAPRNFEEWVTNQFGRRLFRTFFKTYTEKVWGMSCSEISADWAAQRIKGLSLSRAIASALAPRRAAGPRAAEAKTLIRSFRYPRRGPGMMWEAAAEKIRAMGGAIHLGVEAFETAYDAASGAFAVTAREAGGRVHRFAAQHVVSSTSIGELVGGLRPAPPEPVRQAARALRHRDLIIVALVVEDRRLFDDNWIYVHDPGVKVGRIDHFKAWSPEMVPDPSFNCYGLEYFCFAGDELWRATDEALIALARRELVQLGLARPEDIHDGHVVRQPKAYPVYDDGYRQRVETVRAALRTRYPNLHLVGRNGMHMYDNQDHAMMTAMLTARNIIAGEALYDPWQVNQDAEYHEAGKGGSQAAPQLGERLVPRRASTEDKRGSPQRLRDTEKRNADQRGSEGMNADRPIVGRGRTGDLIGAHLR